MDRLRAMVTGVAEGAADARLVVALRGLPALLSHTHDGERGQGLAEYALILSLIAIIAIAALIFLGGEISSILSSIGAAI